MNRMMPGVLATIVLIAGAGPAAARTRCVTPGGSSECFHLIQFVVNVSAPGDVVELRPGTYFENVYIEAHRAGIQIVGPASGPPAIVDASSIADRQIIRREPAFTVVAPNVQLRNIAIRNGASDGVRIDAPGVLAERLRIVNPVGAGIRISPGAGAARIVDNQISSAYAGIVVDGPDAVVERNQIVGVRDGIVVGGERARLTENVLQKGGEWGIDVTGNDVALSRNRVTSFRMGGIHLHEVAANPTIDKNVVNGGYEGIRLVCNRCATASVTQNWVNGAVAGLRVTSREGGLRVTTNTVQDALGQGISVEGNDVAVENNRVRNAGHERVVRNVTYIVPCFEISGDRNVVRRNTVERCAAPGFELSGASPSVSLNEVRDGFGAGFLIRGTGAQLVANKVSRTAREGFRNEATASGTSFVSNTSTGTWIGLCDQGQGTSLDRNSFDTVGACMAY